MQILKATGLDHKWFNNDDLNQEANKVFSRLSPNYEAV